MPVEIPIRHTRATDFDLAQLEMLAELRRALKQRAELKIELARRELPPSARQLIVQQHNRAVHRVCRARTALDAVLLAEADG